MIDGDRPILEFSILVTRIQELHTSLQNEAAKSVNTMLTLRNWMIGYYIAEYELRGSDRAEYGDKLLTKLSEELNNLSNCNRRQLYRYLRFFRFYPQIMGTLSPQLLSIMPSDKINDFEIMGTLSPQLQNTSSQIIEALSYSHFDLLVDIDDELKRTFYLLEAMRSNWSVRELKRQIESLYYERSELSLDKTKLAQLTNQSANFSTILFLFI